MPSFCTRAPCHGRNFRWEGFYRLPPRHANVQQAQNVPGPPSSRLSTATSRRIELLMLSHTSRYGGGVSHSLTVRWARTGFDKVSISARCSQYPRCSPSSLAWLFLEWTTVCFFFVVKVQWINIVSWNWLHALISNTCTHAMSILYMCTYAPLCGVYFILFYFAFGLVIL